MRKRPRRANTRAVALPRQTAWNSLSTLISSSNTNHSFLWLGEGRRPAESARASWNKMLLRQPLFRLPPSVLICKMLPKRQRRHPLTPPRALTPIRSPAVSTIPLHKADNHDDLVPAAYPSESQGASPLPFCHEDKNLVPKHKLKRLGEIVRQTIWRGKRRFQKKRQIDVCSIVENQSALASISASLTDLKRI